MRMIDPHLHLDRMKGKDVETLSIAGVEGAVLPTPHMLQWMVSAETLLRMWRMFLDFEVKHSESLGIKVFVYPECPLLRARHRVGGRSSERECPSTSIILRSWGWGR